MGTRLLEHLCAIASINSIEKDFIVTTHDYFKDCINCKIGNQLHIKFKERNVPQEASGSFV